MQHVLHECKAVDGEWGDILINCSVVCCFGCISR